MTIKVLVVDDSSFMRMMISKMLQQDPLIEVIGTARNGRDAIARVQTLRPDVVTMDVEMPEADGLQALKQIMTTAPTPVIMISSLTSEGAQATVDALQNGAFDFIPKPDTQMKDIVNIAVELVSKVKSASKSSLRRFAPAIIGTRTSAKETRTPSNHLARGTDAPPSRKVEQLLAIGTSTGGPRALNTVLTGLPEFIPCPIVIVQHMPPQFTASLAHRLDQSCAIRVVEAEHHQLLQNGVAYVAPGGFHMTVVRRHGEYSISLSEQAKRNEHRPSVDVLFESLAALTALRRTLVIMTGMGNDGAAGMLRAKISGAVTIAESERTAVVYGMPKAAINLGCVDFILRSTRLVDESWSGFLAPNPTIRLKELHVPRM